MNIKKIKRELKKMFRRNKKKNKKIALVALVMIGLVSLGYDQYIQNKYLDSNLVTLSKCVDGDTAKFIIDGKEETVRFLAVDTPETVKPNTPVQPFGKEASEYTKKALTTAETIRLEYEDGNEVDKYGRKLAWIFVDDSLLQEGLVKEGLAEVKYVYGDYKYTKRLYEAEKNAQENIRGIWSLEGN